MLACAATAAWLVVGAATAARAQSISTSTSAIDAARAGDAEAWERPEPTEPEPTTASRVLYRVGLGLTYSLAPALTVTAFLVESPGLGAATIPLWLFSGAIYHGIGQQRALASRALGGTVLSILVGGAVGALVGLPVGVAMNDGGDFGGLGVIVAMLAGLGLGGGAGYLGWAIYDVATADL